MKILRSILSVALIAVIVVGGIYAYRSCSLTGCDGQMSVMKVSAMDNDLEVANYTNVTDDLKKDETFDELDYPEIENDYSIRVIQIAEGVSGNLFVYTYQPSGKIKPLSATTVRMSVAVNEEVFFEDYSLIKCSTSENGTLCKYYLPSYKVKADPLRYYDIAAIHRSYDSEIDEEPSDDNTIDYVAYEVGQRWTAYTVNNNVNYTMQETETITVTEKHVGFIRYDNGFTLYDKACDSHYVAFSTDRSIDKLMEADLT